MAAGRGYVDPYLLAMFHAVLGHTDEALDALEIAFVEHSALRIYLNVDPTFDALRDHPRFARLIERLDLPR